jgi:hypothetical protein
MSEIKSIKPSLKWYQTKESVIVEVDQRDLKDASVKIESDKLHIKFTSNDQLYEDTLELAHEVDASKDKEVGSDFQIRVVLTKTKAESWKSLTKNDKARKNIKVDWSNLNDSEEEQEQPNPMGNFDMSNFMQKGPQGEQGEHDDCDSCSDSDDQPENLKDLEAEES